MATIVEAATITAARHEGDGAMTTVVVDKETRDVVVHALRSYETGALEGFHEILRVGSRAEVAEALDHVSWIMGFLDQAGWGEAGDQETYELSLDRRTLDWIIKESLELEESLAYDVMCLEQVRAGNEDYFPIGHSHQDAIETDSRVLAGSRRRVELFRNLVDRLPAAVA